MRSLSDDSHEDEKDFNRIAMKIKIITEGKSNSAKLVFSLA